MTEKKKRIVVYHSSYGCDSGCCGHVVDIQNHGEENDDRFEFNHPCSAYKYQGEEKEAYLRSWAEDLVREYGCDPADLDWENCVILDD